MRTRCRAAGRSRCSATSTGRPPASTRFTPATASGGARSSSRCSTAFEAIRATMLGGFPPVAGALALLRDLGALGTARFAALLPTSAERLARRLFAGGGSRAWLYGSAGHGDVPMTAAGSAIAGVYLNLLGHAVGWPSPAGGAERLTDALVGYLRERGGDVRTGAARRVDRGRARPGHRRAARRRRADCDRPRRRRRDAARARAPRRRGAAARLPLAPAPLSVRAADGQGRLGARRSDPVGGRGGACRRHRARRRWRGRARRRRSPTASTASRSAVPARRAAVARRSVRAPAGKHTAWAYTHGPRAGVDWAPSSRRSWSASRRKWSGSRQGFVTASWRATCWARLSSSAATATWSEATSAAAATGCDRWYSGRSRASPRTGRRCGACTSEAPPPFPGGAVHGVPGDAAARAALADPRSRRRGDW